MSTDDKPKKSSVRHTRAIQVANSKHAPAAPPAEAITERLQELVHPATYAQMDYYHRLGLRQRLLNLPTMVALVLCMIWRQIGSVSELVRVLAQEGLLWIAPIPVSQQALSKRLMSFPADLFAKVLFEILPPLQQRFWQRERTFPPEIAWAKQRFGRLLIFDGSTLDALWRKLDALRHQEKTPLGGKMAALLCLGSRLPVHIWYDADAKIHDLRFAQRLLSSLFANDLLVIDSGFVDYSLFDALTGHRIALITRPKTNMVYAVVRVWQSGPLLRDRVVRVGCSKKSRCKHLMRLVEIRYEGAWYAYLTNILKPAYLPALMVMGLYRRRWRIEEAYAQVKRLLGLAYLWTGVENGIQLQVWATWILYAVLIDLTDAVASELDLPFEDISVEMVFRGLYHFTQAYHRGAATDPVVYLAQHAKLLGIVKRKRKPKIASEATGGP